MNMLAPTAVTITVASVAGQDLREKMRGLM